MRWEENSSVDVLQLDLYLPIAGTEVEAEVGSNNVRGPQEREEWLAEDTAAEKRRREQKSA